MSNSLISFGLSALFTFSLGCQPIGGEQIKHDNLNIKIESANKNDLDNDTAEAEEEQFDLLVMPDVEREDIIQAAVDGLGLEDVELDRFIRRVDEVLANNATVDPAFFSGADSIAIDRGCSYKYHSYYGSCQDGTVPWGPCEGCSDAWCSTCTSGCNCCDHDWRMVYGRSMSGYRSQGSRWHYIALNAAAVVAWAYYGHFSTSYEVNGYGIWASNTSVRWMMMGDRAVYYLFLDNVDYAGRSYAVYQQLCT